MKTEGTFEKCGRGPQREAGEYAVLFRLYEELNDYLPPERGKKTFMLILKGSVTVGDALGSLGVPLGEVDLVLLNGESVSFDCPLHPGDRLSAYPIFENLDITGITRLRDQPLAKLRRGRRGPGKEETTDARKKDR